MAVLELPNGAMFYEQVGAGEPVCLLHAGIADSRMWQPQIDALSGSFRLAWCDLRGFGASPLPDETFSHADDIATLLRSLQMAPAWIVAASYGGQIALDLALSEPGLVAGLVLFAPAVDGWQPDDAVRAFQSQEEALLGDGQLQQAAELNVQTWLVGPYRARDDVSASLREAVAAMQLAAFEQPQPEHAALRPMTPPVIERLEQIQAPCLVISGGLDQPAFVELGALVASRIPGARRVMLPNAAHLPSLEAPDVCTALLREFLAEHQQSA